MKESIFQKQIIDEIKEKLSGALILKNDANYIQGIPDLLVLYNSKWAMLECKISETANKQPNQEYYIDLLDAASFAAFICPENKSEVLDRLYIFMGGNQDGME